MVDGFTLNRRDRTACGGGVATYIRSSLRPVSLTDLQNKAAEAGLELTITTIQLTSVQKIVVVGVYRPPSTRAIWFTEFNELILILLSIGQLIIMGDINADLMKPLTYPGKALKSSLKLANTRTGRITPTRIQGTSSTCLDIIAIDTRLECTEYTVSDLAATDHFPVIASISISANISPKPIYKRNFKKINTADLGRRLDLINLDPGLEDEVSGLLGRWQGQVMEILDGVAPLRRLPLRKTQPKPWINEDIKFQLGRRDWLGKQLKLSPVEDRAMLENQLDEARRIVKSRIRRSMKDHASRALTSQNSKEVWKCINATTFRTRERSEIPMDLEILNGALSDIVKAPQQSPIECPSSCDCSDSFVFRPISTRQVHVALTNLKSSTATGPDEIPAFILKELAPIIAPTIAKIFNSSLSQGVVPGAWKQANVSPVYKSKGSRMDATNYRPISILPVLARTLEKIVASQLYDFCDSRDVIPPQQFGFRRNSSCEIALLTALDSWMEAVDEGKYVGALLLDLSKAFDSVPHHLLLLELNKIGVGTEALRWFTSYLAERTQRVCSSQVVTQWKPVTRGVPQGSCLSPLLFNIFVRKVPEVAETVTGHSDIRCVQFADDITDSAADKDITVVAQKLTDSFKCVKEFCDSKDLIVNASKTQLIVLKTPNRKLPEDFKIVLDGVEIKPMNSVKLLGVRIDRHLTMGDHIDGVVKKCHGMLGVLRRAAPNLPHALTRLAYIALVRTHLEYANAVLAPSSKSQLDKLDVIQRIAARIIMDLPRDAHAAPLLETLKLPSLESRRNEHIASLVKAALDERSHPALNRFFRTTDTGVVTGDCVARIGVGKKRFKIFGAVIYDQFMQD
jgi:retron-type reverse transcriptase